MSWQTTTTWKASTDPDFIPKMRRILDLYDHPPADGRVVCVDEFGPLNLLPRKGKAWRPAAAAPAAGDLPPHDGVMHMLAALDLATGKLFYRIRARKRWHRVPRPAQGAAGPRGPGEKLYVVCDNFSPHRHAQRPRLVRRPTRSSWCSLPTYGSWLNWIVRHEVARVQWYSSKEVRLMSKV